MKLPKKGEEVYYVMPNRVCIAEWDSSKSLINAFDSGYIFRNKTKAKRFCKEMSRLYVETIVKFK